jgi:hypothetical protein
MKLRRWPSRAAQARAYSQAVIPEGGRTIWLAGQVAIEDSSSLGQASQAASHPAARRWAFSKRCRKRLPRLGGPV